MRVIEVLPDRSILESLKQPSLVGKQLTVTWNQDQRSYRLVRVVGTGQTAVAWLAEDSLDRKVAIKFTLRSDFATHSLDAEARRVNALQSSLFAKIDFFGEPVLDSVDCTRFYAIAVEWIDGQTLGDFLAGAEVDISADTFRQLVRDFCEVLQVLRKHSLTHNDLHDRNVLIRPQADPLTGHSSARLVIIDTGQLKTVDRQTQLLEMWEQSRETLEGANPDANREAIKVYQRRIDWFSRTDQEWVVSHLCSLHNSLVANSKSLDPVAKRFVRGLPPLLQKMVDIDRSRRIDDPRVMHQEVEQLWSASASPDAGLMSSPFDLPSAELIRSDRQLMALFSDEYPRLEACRSYAPIYLYGPRGCGKSTILRSLSFKALLSSEHPSAEIPKIPFIGVYLSGSQELRSRFLLMSDTDFNQLAGHVIRYFNLLLIDALADTLDRILEASLEGSADPSWHMTEEAAEGCATVIRECVKLDHDVVRYAGTSLFGALRSDLSRERGLLWARILDRSEPEMRPDAQLLFDICARLDETWPVLKSRRLVFLIDDYSSQRIPIALQKKLNQAITFSKQGSPIFKVTSEYDGVDLDGVQEGREVHEVNVGYEYVSLTGSRRYRFLQSMLQRRFEYMKHPVDLETVLPPCKLSPGVPMAREIRKAFESKTRFYYHGIDTVSDLCSGDFAMGIDLVRRIFDQSGTDWRKPGVIAPKTQDEAIRYYARQEFEYIRHQSRGGRKQYLIADRLCWLSKECVVSREADKNGVPSPVIKNHIDIRETAIRHLEEQYKESAALFTELVRKGVLFPLQPSRSREGRDSTRRFMIRRILFSLYTTALGRDQPIRIDDVERLNFLLTEPEEFVQNELERTSATSRNDSAASEAPNKKDTPQQYLPGWED